eukprot:TRINITY_DN18785_c0_g1_i1.p2 TRINITY_DN18785_c0_g1~~TRINITY_DN18785_c0_g1_i1.p2  ORF type:complete len:255 (-),score=45.12 TRINITY_DN18785_c0_g1_i1:79-774(-)
MGSRCQPAAKAPSQPIQVEHAADVNYAQAGRNLIQQAKKSSVHSANVTTSVGAPPGRYDAANAIWEHPSTHAVLFVGNAACASCLDTLTKIGVRRVVFCQEEGEGKCHFETDSSFEYLRYPIGRHRGDPLSTKDPLRYFDPLFSFVERNLSEGQNVLIHCLAGAHRAGTAGIACLMHFGHLDMPTAVKVAQQRRPAICPIGGFPPLLKALEAAEADAARSVTTAATPESAA